MRLFQANYYLFIIFLSLTSISAAAAGGGGGPKYSNPGCNDTCRNVTIPFPFGIGANCSLNQWYTIDYTNSTPYLPALNHLEVLGVDLEDQIVTVNTPKISDCGETMSIDLGSSPFLFSKSHNSFVVEGCGSYAIMMDQGSALTGCSTNCLNDGTLISDKISSNCLGIGCCQTTVPYYVKSYTINLTRLGRQLGGDGGCERSAFLVDKNNSRSSSDHSNFIPVSLLWTLSDHDEDRITCCSSYGWRERVKVDTGNGTTVDTWKCFNDYRPVVGNSYLTDGCQATEECARCEGDHHGDYHYIQIYDVDGLVKEWNFTCIHSPRYNDRFYTAAMIAILAGVIITSVSGLIAIIYTSYKLIKKTITKRRRKSVFKRINGGLLLKQQEEINPSLVDKTILFTSRELVKATDNFNKNRILGKGGQGTVYKGMLADGRIVAVKKSTLADESQLEEFINEVAFFHKSITKMWSSYWGVV